MNTLRKLLNWAGTDGLLHIGCSFFICLVVGAFLPIWAAAGITLLIGVAKEIFDLLHPESHSAEWKDLICDAIGIAVGCGIILLYTLL